MAASVAALAEPPADARSLEVGAEDEEAAEAETVSVAVLVGTAVWPAITSAADGEATVVTPVNWLIA